MLFSCIHLKCLSKALLISLCGEIGKMAILSVDKLAIYGAMYLAKYFSYLSMKTVFKRHASMGFSDISAKGGNLYHSWLIQQTTTW